MSAVASVERELRAAVAAEVVAPTAAYLDDMTEARGLHGRADAVALPRTADEVAEVVAWCYERGVAIVPTAPLSNSTAASIASSTFRSRTNVFTRPATELTSPTR